MFFPLSIQASLLTDTPDDAIAKIETIVQKKQADKKTVGELIEAMQKSEAIKVKERAAWALGELQARSAAPALIEAAKHKGLLVRSAALNSLIRMRARSALSTYVNIAETDPILSLRQIATLGLGLLSWEKTIDAMVKLSSDETPEVRGAAALSMGATQSKKSDFTEILKEMEADANPYVQERAQKAMDVAKRKSAAVQAHLKSSDADIRLFGAFYFHSHGSSKDLDELKTAWNGEANENVRYELEQAIIAIKKRAAAAAKAAKEKAAAEALKKKEKEAVPAK